MTATTEAMAGGKPLTRNEQLKIAIPTLAGNIAATLSDPAVDCFSADDEQFLKFHGIYQQDDRDKRKTGKVHTMMIRGRIPGGVLTPNQYRVFDELADKYGNQTLRITTRQSIQFHGVAKSGLGQLMKGIHEALLDTIAACGDVNRNVMSAPTPASDEIRQQVYEHARAVSEALLPTTKAYHSIWIDGVQLNLESGENKDFVDPLYGRQYLPRKFKAAFVIPPVNDMDIFTNCLGFIAIVEAGKLTGYNLTAGGGMGRSHGNDATYARLADVIGFITPDQLIPVARAVLTIHRDFGDRTDRKHARLKYVLAEKGVDWFRAELAERVGFLIPSAKPYLLTKQGDLYGWHKQIDGRNFLTLFVESGRIRDVGTYRLKAALRNIAERFDIEFRLSANQNIILANIKESDVAVIDAVLAEHGVRTTNQATLLHGASLACPALPTCGLALAESERYLPGLIDRIEAVTTELGLDSEEFTIRMTGCPNGCARPYMAEIGFVGKAPGRYQIWLGGSENGTRLARIHKDNVKDPDIVPELRAVFEKYAATRNAGERLGDWVARSLWTASIPLAAQA